MSIPKKIHYCWLSGEKMSKDIQASIDSWKKVMPDYELVLWDAHTFDITSVPWVAEACSVKQWALASDYIRLYAVYTEGGIYLDTDVYVLKRFDAFLKHEYFTSLEYEGRTKIFEGVENIDLEDIQEVGKIKFEAGIFGAVKGHKYVKACMEWYEKHHYLLPCGKYYEDIIAPQIYTAIANRKGFRYKFGYQEIDKEGIKMVIYPASVFTHGFRRNTYDIEEGSYAVHWWAGSWRRKRDMIGVIIEKIKRINMIRKICGKRPLLPIEEGIRKAVSKNRGSRKNGT